MKSIKLSGEDYEIKEGLPDEQMLIIHFAHIKQYFGRKDTPDLIAFFVAYLYIKKTKIDPDKYGDTPQEEAVKDLSNMLQWPVSKVQKIWNHMLHWAIRGEE